MTRTWVNLSKRMSFAYLMLGGLILLFLPTGLTGKLQLDYAHLFHVPLTVGRAATLEMQTVATEQDPQSQECKRLRAANRLLENKYANLAAELQTAHERIDELAGLRTHPEWSGMGFVQADVVTDPAVGKDELLIGCGQQDGVAKGQYVMAELSIIGKISDVTANAARVRLITNRNCRIPVQTSDGKVHGIMVGRGNGTAGIPQIPMRQPVEVNDVVFALENPVAPAVPIVTAKVASSKSASKEPLVRDTSVRPVCDVVNLKRVIVIVPRK
jgi:cell shape-determining protein MreC